MRRLCTLPVLVGLLLLLLAGDARAEDGVTSKGGLTAMQAGPLGRADLVLLADLQGVRTVRGMALAHVLPIRALKGEAPPSGVLTIMIRGHRSTAQGQDGKVPYLEAGAKGRFVFFLRRQEGGVAYALDTLFGAEGSLGAEKLAALERQAALFSISDPATRARRTLAWLLEEQRAKGTWTRVHAARELNHLATVRPDLFDSGVRAAVAKLVRRGALPSQRKWLVLLLRGLHEEIPPEATALDRSGEKRSRNDLDAALEKATTTEARIETFERWLHGGGHWGDALDRLPVQEPPVRVWLLDNLAEAGYRAASERIRSLYAFEEDTEVLRAIVRAMGFLGSAQDVAWLESRIGSLAVRREALVSLARIRTPAALEALERARAAAEEGHADLRGLILYLLGSTFVEVETSAGRRAGPR